ncbi:hypothetical protein NE237_001151 [Protea cynaroides]|uniref:Uncharacterized protein n=1 Tax=Protea cynaroides TaxID=273540 RepID=A0A9Q0QXT3_9MAGN|nr:hypothetical protein NE237_001151 [Protea cynaroides]
MNTFENNDKKDIRELKSTNTIENKSYVVYLGEHSHGPEISPVDLELVAESHYKFLGSYLGSPKKAKDAIFYCYTRHVNGFAATLDEEKAAQIAKHPRVISVFQNRGRQLHTTRSWDFLGLETNGVIPPVSIWKKARFGEDTIIGNLDTGVWPESKSFSDHGYGPIPSKWKGNCEKNSADGVPCNRKLIGAKYFNKGYAAAVGPLNSSFPSARDDEGHGTHTLSTAGGNFVKGASVFGYGNGTSKGGSPRARVATYKVCWPPVNGGSCFDADILAAFDVAIHDGVDVLSVSLGSDPTDYFNDGLAIGSFHAVKNNIIVVASAGNDGPTVGSVSNVSPWLLTVGASTMDREFPTYVDLGNNQKLKGQSLSPNSLPWGKTKMYHLVTGVNAKAKLCLAGTLDPKLVKGKIVVCLRGQNARVDKGEEAFLAGAVGMILANDKLSGNDLIADAHVLPASHISYKDGLAVYAYINSTKAPTAYITRPTTQLGTKPAPSMASFSSKGPNTLTPGILKPDITAPGVSIIASYTGASGPSGQPYDTRRVSFNSDTGTSMSCPHVSGITGLLKTLHPDWSPSAIRSAIMTTARTRNNAMGLILNSSNQRATPFSYGAGHVQPNRAMDPGLVYDLTTSDYLYFLCAIGYNGSQTRYFSYFGLPYRCPKYVSLKDFNYPSITVSSLSGTVTVGRKLKNVGSPATYKAKVHAPKGISVSVEPETLTFDSVGQEKNFKLTLKTKRAGAAKDYVFGQLKWENNSHRNNGVLESYVVYLGEHSHGPEISPADLELAAHSHYKFLGSYLGSPEKAKDSIFYSYTRHINGFAATLEEEKAAEIANHPGVISVFENRGMQLHTTRSWDFLGLETNGVIPPGSIWEKAKFGEDTIIANLDTGVWPESKSFSDLGYGPIPSKWKGSCQNNTAEGVPCNRKLIGAKYFNKGYPHPIHPNDTTARDNEGHGTHTLSTAGGNFVKGASVFGHGNGTSKGGSPRARVATYKVCWISCYDADVLAAFDVAIHDGVDVLSVSLGSIARDYISDTIAIGSFHAVKRGIVVVASAGNDGPTDGSVSNVSPWLFTVGASTIDREFTSYVDLGNKQKFKGLSLSQDSLPSGKLYPLVSAVNVRLNVTSFEEAQLCMGGTLDPKLVKGKIVVCLRGSSDMVNKGEQVRLLGAVGMILVNDEESGNHLIAQAHLLPASHISYKDGLAVYAYINSTKAPTAYITRPTTELGTKPAPSMALFSSKGPNTVTPGILKPDITAPGVSIIASYSEASGPSGDFDDTRRVAFNSESGTSMSCPHISGVAGLLKTLHPDWSPSAIRSAIMTTG